MFHGLGASILGKNKFEEGNARIEKTYQELELALKHTKTDPESRKLLRKGFEEAITMTRSEVSAMDLKNAELATKGMKAAKAIAYTSAAITAGLGVGAVVGGPAASLIVSTTQTAAMGAAGGAAVGAGTATAKTAAVSLLNAELGKNFFCTIASDLKKAGPDIFNEALNGAAFGAVAASLGGVTVKGVQLAVKAAGSAAVGVGVVGVGKEAIAIQSIIKDANKARSEGNNELADELIAKAREEAVKLGVDFIAIAAGLKVGKLSKKDPVEVSSRTSAQERKLASGLREKNSHIDYDYPLTLKEASLLSNQDRVKTAKNIIRRRFDDKMERAIIEAHEVGGQRGFGNYTKSDFEEKKAILIKAGFSEDEISILLRKGVAGKYADLEYAEMQRDRQRAEQIREVTSPEIKDRLSFQAKITGKHREDLDRAKLEGNSRKAHQAEMAILNDEAATIAIKSGISNDASLFVSEYKALGSQIRALDSASKLTTLLDKNGSKYLDTKALTELARKASYSNLGNDEISGLVQTAALIKPDSANFTRKAVREALDVSVQEAKKSPHSVDQFKAYQEARARNSIYEMELREKYLAEKLKGSEIEEKIENNKKLINYMKELTELKKNLPARLLTEN